MLSGPSKALREDGYRFTWSVGPKHQFAAYYIQTEIHIAQKRLNEINTILQLNDVVKHVDDPPSLYHEKAFGVGAEGPEKRKVAACQSF